MTKILILGGGGMIGQKLARRITAHDIFDGAKLTLFDRAFPKKQRDRQNINGQYCRRHHSTNTGSQQT